MAGNTAIYGWPYPEGDDAPDVPARMLALANAAEGTVKNIADRLGIIEGAWYSYAPTWNGGSPSIGNGVLTGAFHTTGRTVRVRIALTAGSTTTFGGASWNFSLPVGIAARTVSGHSSWPLWVGQVIARDVSASNYERTYVCTLSSGATTIGTIPSITATVPFTWANTDHLAINIEFEAA